MITAEKPRKMRILALSGAYSNVDVLSIQLAPFIAATSGCATFHLAHGGNFSVPPHVAGQFFGPPPNYSWSKPRASRAKMAAAMRRIKRDAEPEVIIRGLSDKTAATSVPEGREALERLYGIMEQEGPFDGVLGYSEGAGMAATLLVDEARRYRTEGREPMMRFAIFFAGWPPLDTDPNDKDESRFCYVLADSHGQAIPVPTLHVMGSKDPFAYCSTALYNLCDRATARLYDHGKGHFVPREPDMVEDIAAELVELLKDVKPKEEEVVSVLSEKMGAIQVSVGCF